MRENALCAFVAGTGSAAMAWLGLYGFAWNDYETEARALDRGARMGPTPFGYLRDDNGTLMPHPEHGKIVTEAFKLAARDGVPAALDYLRAKAPDDRTWTAFTVRRMLRNPLTPARLATATGWSETRTRRSCRA